jgi:RNA polymerase sigma-70 factor, ECF subfamily
MNCQCQEELRRSRAFIDGIARGKALFCPMSDAQSLVALIPRLRRYARALVGERAAADDLVQDTLERAWSKLHLYRRGTDLRAWLFTVMHNVHVNQVRAARPTAALDDEMPELAQRAVQGDALLVRDLERALAALPAAQREVLLLVVLEDLSYDETARVLGIPIGTVMSRLARAREKVRVSMHGKGNSRLQVVK